MFAGVRKHIPSSPNSQVQYFLTDAQLHKLITVKYDFVCSLDKEQAISRMVDIAKVYAHNIASISNGLSHDDFLYDEESGLSNLSSALTPLMGCVSDSGLQIIHYEAAKCLNGHVLSKTQALKVITGIVDLLPARSFVILADMSSIPAHSWIRGKFSGIGNIWSHVLNVLCHEWACNVGRVICYHVSFTTQAYISAKINEPALETMKFSKLAYALKNMGPRCVAQLDTYLDNMTLAKRDWKAFLNETKRRVSPIQAYRDAALRNLPSHLDVGELHLQSCGNAEKDAFEAPTSEEPPVLACTEAPQTQVSVPKSSQSDGSPISLKSNVSAVKYVDILEEATNDMPTDEGDEVMT